MFLFSRLLTTDAKLLVVIAWALLALQSTARSQEPKQAQNPNDRLPPKPETAQAGNDQPGKSTIPLLSGKWKRRAANREEIRRWIEELGDKRFRTREEASKALEEVGNPALEALAEAAKNPDLEVQRRAKHISELIEVNEAVAPTLIKLQLHDAPIPEAVAELARQSPLKLELVPQQGVARQQLEQKRISLELDQAPFWEGLECLCQAAGLSYSPTAAQTLQLQLIEGSPPRLPTAPSGAFRFRVTGSHYQRVVNLLGMDSAPQAPGVPAPVGGVLPSRSEQLTLNLDVVAEPHISILALGNPQLSEAKDGADQSLLTEGSVADSSAPPSPYPVPLLMQPMQRKVNLRPSTQPAATLKVLKGTLPVEVVARRRSLVTVENIQEARGKVFKGKGDLFLVILQVQDHGNGQSGQIRFVLTGLQKIRGDDQAPWAPGVPGPRRLHGYGEIYRHHFELTDDQGRPFNLDLNTNYSGDPAPVDILEGTLNYSANGNAGRGFRPPVFGGPANVGPSAKLTFYDLKRIRGNVPFEFHEVPMP